MDQLKLISDDSYYTEDHIMFLLDKCRTLLLNQKYQKGTKEVSLSNYQTLCLDLKEVPAIAGVPCEGGSYLRSSMKLPNLMDIGNTRLYSANYYNSNITFVPMERMKYVGHNRFLQNIIYASIGPDNYLYLTSSNSQFKYLEEVKLTGIFEDAASAAEYDCNKVEEENTCIDKLDLNYPIEEALIEPLIEYVVKVMSGYIYRPKDSYNNNNDDLSNLMDFLQRNMKSNFQKQLE
jgi:hypothetical protein